MNKRDAASVKRRAKQCAIGTERTQRHASKGTHQVARIHKSTQASFTFRMGERMSKGPMSMNMAPKMELDRTICTTALVRASSSSFTAIVKHCEPNVNIGRRVVCKCECVNVCEGVCEGVRVCVRVCVRGV